MGLLKRLWRYIVFEQERVGKDEELFTVYKFHTMKKGTDSEYEKLCKDNNLRMGEKIPNDPRVTKIGKFMRRHNYDEIPNFINILKGNLRTLGTRPLTPLEFTKFESEYPDLGISLKLWKQYYKKHGPGFIPPKYAFYDPSSEDFKLKQSINADIIYFT